MMEYWSNDVVEQKSEEMTKGSTLWIARGGVNGKMLDHWDFSCSIH